jgi:hypothetical protein
MRRIRGWITLVCCLFAMTVFAWAQARKPGLWALTSTTTREQSPFPAGLGSSPAGGNGNSPFDGGARTTQGCLTQQQDITRLAEKSREKANS